MVVKKNPTEKVVKTPKTTVKKPVVQNAEVVETPEVVQTPEVEAEPIPQPTRRKKAAQIERSEMIPCRSTTHGKLTYISTRTGVTITWDDYGTIEYVEYGEILTMRSSQPKFLNKPWIVIEDEEAVSTIPNLAKLYKDISQIGENLEDFFKKEPSVIEKILTKVPNGTKALIASKAREMVDNGTLYDTRIIGIIDKMMNTGLKDFIK